MESESFSRFRFCSEKEHFNKVCDQKNNNDLKIPHDFAHIVEREGEEPATEELLNLWGDGRQKNICNRFGSRILEQDAFLV